MSTNPDYDPQPLDRILFEEGLSYRAVADLCPTEAKVNEQTIADVATGRIHGKDKTRAKILNALNRYQNKQRGYTWDDLYNDPPGSRGVLRRVAQSRVVQKVLHRDLESATES